MPRINEVKRARGHSRGGALAPVAALVLGAMAPAIGSANPITTWTVNAYVTTYAVGNRLSSPTPYEPVGASETYTGNYAIYPIGSGPQVDDPGCCSTLGPVPSQPSLTSVTLGTTSTNSGNGVASNASAYANLATGSVGVSGSSNWVDQTGGNSASAAALGDTLTFNIPGASSSTITDITVRWSVSGDLSSVAQSLTEDSSDAEMKGNLVFGSQDMGTEWDSDGGVLSNNLGTGASHDWVSSTVVSNSADSVIIDGVYALDGEDPTVPLSLYLQCTTDLASSCDYYDTESIDLILPAGVTYTSASGVFLSQSATSVPEPDSLLLFGSALLALGWTLRRSRSSGARVAGLVAHS